MENLTEKLEKERQQKIQAIQDKPKDAKEVNLNKFPTTHAASLYLEGVGWKRGTFRVASYQPYQNLADMERILRIEARKKGRQLTRSEVEQNLRKFERTVGFLYSHVTYKKDPTIDEEIELKISASGSKYAGPEMKKLYKEKIEDLKKQKNAGRVYSIETEEKRRKSLEWLSLEERILAEEVINDLETKKSKKK